MGAALGGANFVALELKPLHDTDVVAAVSTALTPDKQAVDG
jgi:hypothetical protein